MKNNVAEVILADGISDIEKDMCVKYWDFDGTKFINEVKDIANEYGYSTGRLLLSKINQLSSFKSVKKCSHKQCNSRHEFTNRTKVTENGYREIILRNHFPTFLERYDYLKQNGMSVPGILTCFKEEDYYCKEHSKEIVDEYILKKSTEFNKNWIPIEPKLAILLEQFKNLEIGIYRFADESIVKYALSRTDSCGIDALKYDYLVNNYMNPFKGGNIFKDRTIAWLFFCDYWLVEEGEWAYTEESLISKYNLTNDDLNEILYTEGKHIPSISGLEKDEIIHTRSELSLYVAEVLEDEDEFMNIHSLVMDAKEQREQEINLLAHSLREIADSLLPYKGDVLRLAANHIENNMSEEFVHINNILNMNCDSEGKTN